MPVGVTAWRLLHVLRLVLLAVFGFCKTIVRVVLFSSLACRIVHSRVVLLRRLAGTGGFVHDLARALFSCALVLALYEGLLGMLRR